MRVQRSTNSHPRDVLPCSAGGPHGSLGMSGPALRALHNAGIKSMAAVSRWAEDDLAELHGMGPGAIKVRARR